MVKTAMKGADRLSLENKIRKRLKSNAGETIAEVLIALLIAALALTMLASVISASTRIISQSKAKLADYYAANNQLSEEVKIDDKITETTGVTFVLTDNTVEATHSLGGSGLVTTYTYSQLSNVPVISYSYQSPAGGGETP